MLSVYKRKLIDWLIKDDFNNQIDKLREEPWNLGAKSRAKLSDPEEFTEEEQLYNELSNRVEFSRRIFNSYLCTGEITLKDV